MASKAQIVVTIGPSSSDKATLLELVRHQADVVRLNFAWGNIQEKIAQIETVRAVEKELNKKIPIIADLPGPRIQNGASHAYEKDIPTLTNTDIEHIKFAIQQKVDYFALSFIGSAKDIKIARKTIKEFDGNQRIIAKIERKIALESIQEIIAETDAVMVARGDLGSEIPLETIPFAQEAIISLANIAKKPVITATEMLLSMKNSPRPTRAEVTDVANAILQGSDAVMLSEETSVGKYPIETVTMMEKIVVEAEKHSRGRNFNTL